MKENSKKNRNAKKSGRKASRQPALFRRGKKGIYYFRHYAAGKEKWVSTKTADKEKAAEIAIQHVDSGGIADSERDTAKLIRHFSLKLAKAMTGRDIEAPALSEVHAKWESLTPSYGTFSKKTKEFCKSVLDKFASGVLGRVSRDYRS